MCHGIVQISLHPQRRKYMRETVLLYLWMLPTEVEIEIHVVSEEVPTDLDEPVSSEGKSGVESTPKVVDKCNFDESSIVSDEVQPGVLSSPKKAVVNESSSDKSFKDHSGEIGSVSSFKQLQPGHVRPKAIGELYSAEERKNRQVDMEKHKLKRNLLKVQMLKCGNESAPYVCPIIDSHFHYDRLQALAGVRNLSAILKDGLIPSVPVDLVGVVVNYCNGVPVKAGLDSLRTGQRFTLCFWCAP